MKLYQYSIYDSCAGIYNQPFVQNSDNEAIRSFTDLAISDETNIGKHPEHYSLVRIGTWDNKHGQIEGMERETIITGNEAIAAAQKIVKHSLKDFDKKVGGTN